MPPTAPGPVEIVISYAHEDEGLRAELTKHLAALKRQGVIRAWHDREIRPGAEWRREIGDRLEGAQVILLLVSPDFLASDFCYDVEMSKALERHNKGEAVVIPVILRPVDWKGTPFQKLQALPADARPVTTWPNIDEAMFNVAQGIRRVVEELKRHDAPRPPSSKGAAPRPPEAEEGVEAVTESEGNLKLPTGDAPFPLRLLREAIRAVPAVKYALGVTGVAAAISIVAGFQINLAVAVLGVVIMFVLMTVLVIFSSFARSSHATLKPLSLTLAWSFVVLTIGTATFIFTGFFFSWPRPLGQTAESITGRLGWPTPTPTPSPTPETRALSYSIQVCEQRSDPQCQNPFTLARAKTFEEGDRIKLSVSGAPPGYLYLIDEGPKKSGGLPEYVFLFPTLRVNEGSAKLDPSRTWTFPNDGWLLFDSEEGQEKLWLVWSAEPDGDLEGVLRNVFLRPEDRGQIKRPGDIVAVQRALEKYSNAPHEVREVEDRGRTEIRWPGRAVAYPVVLEHR